MTDHREKPVMRILLIGATGQLGSDLIRNNPGHHIVAPARTELDVTRSNTIAAAIRETRPDWVFNTAAFHNVPLCEEQPEQAFRTNCVAVRDLALACKTHGGRLITFSTDYVFSGEQRKPYSEEDCPRPVQTYGISKLAGETIAQAVAADRVIVVRTCGLYGLSGAASKGGNFVDKRLKDGRALGVLEMGCDQTVCPTSTDDLSKAVYDLIAKPSLEFGVYHLVNEGECTWYEFTRAIYEYLSIGMQVNPVDRGGHTNSMRRPLYSVLANTRGRALGIRLPPWQDALKRYLQEKTK
jgi:dTDP-4-dehydrorhamnose reductase